MKTSKIVLNMLVFAVLIAITTGIGSAEKISKKTGASKKESECGYVFKTVTEVKCTPVKNQYRTGTCWCFSTVSFIESELLRMGKGEFDLSEMFVVRQAYPQKAMRFFRMHGMANHSSGGQAHDVLDVLRAYGMVPETVYTGMRIDEKRHNHGEMVSVLDGILDAVMKNKGQRVTPRWLDAYRAVLDVYLGNVPTEFSYNGNTYTPRRFADEVMGINPDDYIEFTSYTHHPFYQKCWLDIPDNWTYNANYYNIPIDDLERTIDHALKSGYSVIWDGDVSEKEFESKKMGFAVVPEKDWDDKTYREQEEDLTGPVKEKAISQEMRQHTFDNWTTTDDHLMHVVGIAQDQNGEKFYIVKNSGGTQRANGGYVYLSRAYFRLKTVALMVHKNAMPEDLKTRLGL
ncbi:MAG: aminopeptidase C [Candidatus Omnitrophota bacterium]